MNPESCDWQDKATTYEERNKHILQNQLYTDVEFLVKKSGKQQVFKAHKLKLAQASSVFETMFYGSVLQEYPIVLNDIEPAIFEEFLNLIYFDEIQVKSVPEAWELYRIAHKYRIFSSLETIRNQIKRFIEQDKTYCILCFENSEHFNDEDLKNYMIDQIVRYTDQIIKSDNFLDAKLTTLSLIVQQPSLSVSDIELFAALDKYNSHFAKSDKKPKNYDEMMRKIIKEIRFLTFTVDEFLDTAFDSTLLTDLEKLKITKTINSTIDIKPWNCPTYVCPNQTKHQAISSMPSTYVLFCAFCNMNCHFVKWPHIVKTPNFDNMPENFTMSKMDRNILY